MSELLTTITGVTSEEISNEIWETIDAIISEKLYENGVAEEEFDEFRKEISSQLVENLEESL